MQMPFHVAPGLGDMAPGWFALPQNPLTMGASTVLVPTMGATAPGRRVKTPHLADLVAGSFAVPQNPVRANLAAGLAALRGMGAPFYLDPWDGLPGASQSQWQNQQWQQRQWANQQWTSLSGLGCGRCNSGCDGGNDGNFYGLNGLGQVPGTDPISQFLFTNLGAPGAWLADETTFMSFSLPMW